MDWFRFTTDSAYSQYRFALSNVPGGASYSFHLYDATLTSSTASFASDGSAARVGAIQANTTYYIRIGSLNGAYSASQPYSLSAIGLYNAPSYPTPAGNVVQIYNNNVYIDGQAIDLSWETRSTTPSVGMPYYTFAQSIVGTPRLTGALSFGSYSGYTESASDPYPHDIYSDNAVLVEMTDFYYFFYHYRSPNADFSVPSYYESWSEQILASQGDFDSLVIDATTKEVIDLDKNNLYYWKLRHKHSFQSH